MAVASRDVVRPQTEPDLRALPVTSKRRVHSRLGTGCRTQNRRTLVVPQLGRDGLTTRDVIPQRITNQTTSLQTEGESPGLRLRLAVRERVPDGATGGSHRARLLRESQEMRRRRGPTEQQTSM